MRSAENAEWGKCGVGKMRSERMRSVENVVCGKDGV